MTWLLPVGIPGGVSTGFVGQPDRCGVVRCGGQTLGVAVETYLLWRAAAVTPDRGELTAWAHAQNLGDVELRLTTLLEAGLLVERSSGAVGLDGFAGLAVRLVGELLGNVTSPAGRFVVRGAGGARVEVDARVYEALLRTDGVTTIPAVCAEVDGLRTDIALPPTVDTLLEGIPVLVSSASVCLDRAVR